VVAPALMPKQAGDRGNTDRRDAPQLARFMRAGALPPSLSSREDAAMRDLRRAREETLRDLKSATLRLQACLLRHDIRSRGQATWGPAPRRWRSAVVCPPPAQQIVFQEDVRAVTGHTERLQRLDQALQEQVHIWRLAPVVEALQALRGSSAPSPSPPWPTWGPAPLC